MNKIKGIKQVTFSEFESTIPEDRKGYLWFVRDFDDKGEYAKASIYLGNRQYADTNEILSANDYGCESS